MNSPAKNVPSESRLTKSGLVVRSRQDITMGYVLMALPVACVLAGIAQFVPAWQQSAEGESLTTPVQQSPARCERPTQSILDR